MINDGKLKFEKLDEPAEVEDPSRAKFEMLRQEKEASKGARLRKVAISKEKVHIAKVRKNEVGSSPTTEESKERSCEPNGEQEKNMLQDSAQGFEKMFVEQNECVITLIEEHNLRTLKRRQTLGSDEA